MLSLAVRPTRAPPCFITWTDNIFNSTSFKKKNLKKEVDARVITLPFMTLIT